MKSTILRIPFLLIGALLIANAVFMITTSAAEIGKLLTLLLGLCFFLPAVFYKQFLLLLKHPAAKIITALIGFACAFTLVSSSFLYHYGNTDNVTYKEDYLIVLGCSIHGDSPSYALAERLNKAIEYHKRNPKGTIIVSGGQGPDEAYTEAYVMKKYLVEHGINADSIIEEDRSTSTTENFKYSYKLMDKSPATVSAAFVTSDFHVYRAEKLAALLGYDVTHIGAYTVRPAVIPSYLREQLALVKMFVFGN